MNQNQSYLSLVRTVNNHRFPTDTLSLTIAVANVSRGFVSW